MVNKSIVNKKLLNKLFVGVLIFLEILILVGLALLIIFTNWEVTSTTGKTIFDLSSAFQVAALALILIWFGILVAYYAWAIYFYNINLGLTNQDWAEIREQKSHTPDGKSTIPTENPNADQTLGLPPGTVRGTVALTLLVGGLAMAIASLGMDSIVKEDSFIVDNFDFFKTAFLMMIAFYFGNKSLEMIGYKSSKVKKAESGSATVKPVNNGTTSATSTTTANSTNSDSDFDNPLAVQ